MKDARNDQYIQEKRYSSSSEAHTRHSAAVSRSRVTCQPRDSATTTAVSATEPRSHAAAPPIASGQFSTPSALTERQ